MRVSAAGYGAIVRILRGAAERIGCPIALVTEGGYDLEALRACVAATLEVLQGEGRAVAIAGDEPVPPRAARALAQVRAAQSPFWRAI
jgi:acetoin utilization deacetylase AcuC-like enzyme